LNLFERQGLPRPARACTHATCSRVRRYANHRSRTTKVADGPPHVGHALPTPAAAMARRHVYAVSRCPDSGRRVGMAIASWACGASGCQCCSAVPLCHTPRELGKAFCIWPPFRGCASSSLLWFHDQQCISASTRHWALGIDRSAALASGTGRASPRWRCCQSNPGAAPRCAGAPTRARLRCQPELSYYNAASSALRHHAAL
jgi:hypothetical protein